MKIHLRPFEYTLHAYMLILLSGAFIPLWQTMRTGAGIDLVNGDPFTRVLLMIGYSLTLPFLLIEPRQVVRRIVIAPWVWFLVSLALLSVFWSLLPALTFRRSVAVVLTTLYALVLVQRLTLQEFTKLLGGVLFFMLASSLLVIILFPAWGKMTEPHAGAWQGIFVHKNILGRISTISLLIFGYFLTADRERRQRWLWITGFSMAVITLFGSRSTTALVLAMAVFLSVTGVTLVTPLNRKHKILFFLILTAIGLTALWIFFYTYVDILDLLGKDATLTGRIPLWLSSLEMGLQRPWLGQGFSAFWQGWQGPSAPIWSAVLWEPPHGHNGYLDLFLDLGAVGLTLGLTVLTKSGFILSRMIWRSRITSITGLLFGLWIFMVVYNFNESAFLRQNSLLWLLLVYVSFQLESGWVISEEIIEDGRSNYIWNDRKRSIKESK